MALERKVNGSEAHPMHNVHAMKNADDSVFHIIKCATSIANKSLFEMYETIAYCVQITENAEIKSCLIHLQIKDKPDICTLCSLLANSLFAIRFCLLDCLFSIFSVLLLSQILVKTITIGNHCDEGYFRPHTAGLGFAFLPISLSSFFPLSAQMLIYPDQIFDIRDSHTKTIETCRLDGLESQPNMVSLQSKISCMNGTPIRVTYKVNFSSFVEFVAIIVVIFLCIEVDLSIDGRIDTPILLFYFRTELKSVFFVVLLSISKLDLFPYKQYNKYR